MAADYLESRGWVVVGRNVREGRKEVDLVVERDGIVAFVEVKTRRGVGFGHPLESITPAKRAEIAEVARAWVRKRILPPGTRIRFDAVAVLRGKGREIEILYLPDAWRLE